MIIEQAFYNLPEILTGYGYPSQEYEGGIVGAFSLAVLQELNGRNVNNPISLMQMEKPFRKRTQPWIASGNKKRYLRCDFHLNTWPIKAGSQRLSTYGWRHRNWLEAKFFRAFTKGGKPKKSSNQVVNTAQLLADVIRLLTLVPQERSNKDDLSISNRYLLHVYLNRPEDHITTQTQQGGHNVDRPWVAAITKPGQQQLAAYSLANETAGVRNQLGRQLNEITIGMTVTNFIVTPLTRIDGQRLFECYLSRVDAFQVTRGNDSWGIDADRVITSSSGTAQKDIADFIGARISITGGIEQQKPTVDEAEEDVEDVAPPGNVQAAAPEV